MTAVVLELSAGLANGERNIDQSLKQPEVGISRTFSMAESIIFLMALLERSCSSD